MTRWILLVLGILLTALGAIWVLQGAGVIAGSFMTGQKLWFLLGLLAVLLGVGIIAGSARRKSR